VLGEAITLWAQLLLVTAFVFSTTYLNISTKEYKSIIRTWIGFASIISLYTIYQIFARNLGLPFGLSEFTSPSAIGPFLRPTGTFSEASFLGTYLLPPVLVVTFVFLYRNISNFALFGSRKVDSIIIFVNISAFLFTLSLGAYVCIAGTVFIALLKGDIVKRFAFLVLIISTVLITAGLSTKAMFGINFSEVFLSRNKALILEVLDYPQASGSASPFAKTSANARLEDVRDAFSVFMENPLIGSGLNRAPLVASGLVSALAQMGILGAIGIIMIFSSALFEIRGEIHHETRGSDAWILLKGMYYSVWAVFLNVLFVRGWQVEAIWFVLAIAMLTIKWSRKARHGDGYSRRRSTA
jgi:hypothetical protein